MAALADLPHVGGVASRLDPERVRRTVAEVRASSTAVSSTSVPTASTRSRTYRGAARARASCTGEPWGDVFLVIDGWGNSDRVRGPGGCLNDIAARGLGYGIHVVVSASRYMEVRAALKDQILSRLELRLGDPMDSEFDRKVAVNVPAGVPGRGQVSEKLHFMTACPVSTAPRRRATCPRRRPRWPAGQGRLAGARRSHGASAAAQAAGRPAAQGLRVPAGGHRHRHRRGQPGAGLRRPGHRPVLPGLR